MRILFSLLFLVNIIYASVAVVSAFKGQANIYRDGKEISVYIGIEINKNDSIKTQNNTKLQLIFKDNTRITIGKNSQFSVEDYFYDEVKKSKSRARFKFTKGLFRTISGRIGKINKKQFKIIVKSATIGIRGTVFDVYVNTASVKVGVYEGAIYFENNNEVVDVKTNHFFVFEYLKDKKIIKEGKIEESNEFEEKDKEENTDEEIDNSTINENKNDTVESNTERSDDTNSKDKNTNQVESLIPEDPTITVLQSTVRESVPTVTTENAPTSQSLEANENLEKQIIDNGTDIADIADLDYGYWIDTNDNDKRVDSFITGTLTADALIQTYIDNSNTASYSGGISSFVTDSSGVKTDAAGTISLNIDFGAKSLSGDISINNGQYNAHINSGTVNSSDFSSTDIIQGSSSEFQTASGTLDGNFYGTIGDSVGGTFTLEGQDGSSVSGSFGGAKQ